MARLPRSPTCARRSPLAREKQLSRAEARRRTRETMRAEQATDEESSLEDIDDEEEAEPQPARKSSFKMPNIREDLRAMPGVFRTRRLLWVPLLLLLAGFVLQLVLYGLPVEIGTIVNLYIQYFFLPPTLFTFFLAGFLAPRGSYLVGAIYGIIAGLLWSIMIVLLGTNLVVAPPEGTTTPATSDILGAIANVVILETIFGTFAAALAAWYRDFLRGMSPRGQARRAEREATDRAKRRDERQQSRRVAKQRPTSSGSGPS